MSLLLPNKTISLILPEGSFSSRILRVANNDFSVFRPLYQNRPIYLQAPMIRVNVTDDALWTLDCPIRQIAHMVIELEVPPPANIAKIQRRQYLRVPIQHPIRYQVRHNGTWKTGILADLSGGGCKLLTSNQYSVGTSIAIEWELDGHLITLSGTIIDERKGPSCLIIRFDIDESLREALMKQLFAKHRQHLKKMSLS